MGRSAASARDLFTGAARGYDTVAQALSFGQYRRWQRSLVEAARIHGIGPDDEVLDVATGTGLIAGDLVRATDCDVVGLDLTRAMLLAGRARLASLGSRHLGLVQGDATRLPFANSRFDGLTFSYLYRYVADPEAATRELSRVVRPDGFVGMVEFHMPSDPVLRSLWRVHTRIGLPAAGAFAGRGWYRVGRFLGPSIEGFYARHDIEDLTRIWQASGLVDVQARSLSLGGGLVMWARKEA